MAMPENLPESVKAELEKIEVFEGANAYTDSSGDMITLSDKDDELIVTVSCPHKSDDEGFETNGVHVPIIVLTKILDNLLDARLAMQDEEEGEG